MSWLEGQYKKVKADKIQNVCRDLFNFSLMNIVTIGNLNQNMLKILKVFVPSPTAF